MVGSQPYESPSLLARLMIGTVAAILVVGVGRSSFVTALSARDPAAALRLDSDASTALAASAYDEISPSPSAAGADRAIAQTRRALAINPMSATAATNLGLALEIKGDRAAAAKLIDYSEALSRRNLITQLWLIEYWVSQGDVPRTLKHYDIAMRTSSAALGLLFPVLVSATNDPAIIRPLARILAGGPDWGTQFVQQLVQSGDNLPNIATLLVDLARLGRPATGRALATMIDRLVADGSYDVAAQLYGVYRPKSSLSGLRNGDFAQSPEDPTAFDWNFPETDGLSADIRERALYLDAAPATGGVAARQLVKLSAGDRLFRATVTGFEGVGTNRPYMVLKCAGSGTELGRQALGSGETPSTLNWSVTIPASCAMQSLEIVLQPVDAVGGAAGHIDRLMLVR